MLQSISCRRTPGGYEITSDYLVILDTPEGEYSFRCRDDEVIWNAAARNGIALPAICHQGHCLTCASRLVKGEVDQSLSRAYFNEDKKEGYVLPCTGRPRSNVQLVTHQARRMREFRKRAGLPAPYF